ncbi:type II secretion system protein GspD [Pseudofulvibacter geojedonensis]|uniref:Type II secretion system protein GspD n=1 Tax=Pseudofulvibacter geojedonensis TaxID=1123758 RepID=A0ABW3I202_9FLAO
MKKILLIFLLSTCFCLAQQNDSRIENIKNQLTALSVDNLGLTENVKTEISVNNITLPIFLLAVSNIHKININVSPELNNITLANNFSNVTVSDLLVFLCKEYDLNIDFTGNILSIKKHHKPVEAPLEKIIPVNYNPNSNLLSIDAKGDKLYDVFKRIMDISGKNLVFSPGLENKNLTAYIKDTPFEAAMDKLAFANNLYVEKTKDNFFLFEDNETTSITSNNSSQNNQATTRPKRRRKSNFYFKVLDYENKILDVDFANTPIADIIHDIGNELKIDVFTATPLDDAGVATLKAKSINFDYLLNKIFEPQSKYSAIGKSDSQSGSGKSNSNSKSFTYKKENNIYFFGTANQLSVRQVEIIHLMHRSVALLDDSAIGNSSFNNNFHGGNSGFSNSNNNYSYNQFNNINRGQQQQNNNSSSRNYNNGSQKNNIVGIIPDEVKNGIEFNIDTELNSIYVSGTQENIQRFKEFIHKIDKPIPLVLIEVMFIEVSKNATIETGVTWGIGDAPVTTKGGIYPTTDLTLGAQTINNIIGGFKGFGTFNLGKVVPNFFATIKAMETNGDIKIKSTPKLSTLNGHSATFSSGQQTYYTVTQRNIYGTDNPQTSEFTNYHQISAELGLTIKPYVSGNGNVTLSIDVIQSSFGNRIAVDAPPDINSRAFNSSIRAQDQDIIILGGLEEQIKRNSGTGVPFLSKIPVIKWLFSSRKREASKSKLAVLIKPTVIY